MGQAGSIRFERGITAGAVVLAHVLLVWIIIEARVQISERDRTTEPVIATLLDEPRQPSPGVVPVEVKTEQVQQLQNLAPKIPDIPEEAPDPIPSVESVPVPTAAAPVPANGADGTNTVSSGPRGGGRLLSIIQRIVPKYPRISARLGEQGVSVMQLRVDEAGRVVEAKVARGSGSGRLDQAALEAVRKWKFAPAARGSAPNGTWGEVELRFVLYRITYSRIGGRALDSVSGEQARSGAKDEPTPGADAALKRFIADVRSGAISGDPDAQTRGEVDKLRAALNEWGDVKSLQFSGGGAERSWVPYEIKPAFRVGMPNVEVRWDMYEVRHQHATSEWLIAVDREGTIWNAQVGPAPTQ
jgi:protein TonB